MKTVAFHLHVKHNVWWYEDMQLQELEKQEWLLTVGKSKNASPSRGVLPLPDITQGIGQGETKGYEVLR